MSGDRDGVQPYQELRANLARRDRSLREKVVTLAEAASFVADGATVGIGGSTLSRTPMALVWQLIRARKKELSCSRCIISTDGDLLIGSGVANHIISSWFAQGILWGLSKVMRHHVESGNVRYDEWSHMGVGMRFRAGAMGIPFMPSRTMLGSGVAERLGDSVKAMTCPFTGEQLELLPALNPDVALIHVQRCDAFGHADVRPAERHLPGRAQHGTLPQIQVVIVVDDRRAIDIAARFRTKQGHEQQ